MNTEEYFNEINYTGYHYHEECWEPVFSCYLETIIEERIDGSWDVFLDEPLDNYENSFLIKEMDHQDTPTGFFLFNAKDKEDVTKKIKDWVANELSRLRSEKNRK
jgi:flavodoxin